jgi:hypothetical protein
MKLISVAGVSSNEAVISANGPPRILHDIAQGRSVHVNCVSPANTLKNETLKKPSVLLSWFSGTPYTGTQQNRSDRVHC